MDIYSKARSSIDRRIVAGLAGAAAALAAGLALHFLMAPGDADGDGVPDSLEEEWGTDPSKPNLNVYAERQGIEDKSILDSLKRFDDTAEGRELVDAVGKTLQAYPELKEKIIATLKNYGHRISGEEVKEISDLDDDGILNWEEKIIGGDPLRKDEVLVYGLRKLNPEEVAWEIVKRINGITRGELSEDAKRAVDAVASTPESVRDDERYVKAVDEALNRGLKDAAVTAGDVDRDGLSNSKEVELGADPFAANPVVAYAVENGLNTGLLNLLFPLERDGRLDANDKKFIAILHKYQDNLLKEARFRSKVLKRSETGGWYTPEEEVAATPLTLAKYVVGDGAVDKRELTAVEIVGEKPVAYMGLSGRLAVGWQPVPGGGGELLLKFTPEELEVLIDFLASHPDFARANPYATYGLVKGGSMLLHQLGNGTGIPTIMKPLDGGMDYAKAYTWNGVEVSVKKAVDAHVANLEGCPEVLERLKADYVLENAGDPLTADLRVVTAAFPPYLLHIADLENRMYFYEVLPRDVAYDALPRLWLAWKNVNYWPKLHEIAERVLAGKEIDPDTKKPYTSVDSLKLRFDDFGPKTRADMLKLATQGSEMAKAAFPLYHYAIYNHESIDEFRVELYRALMWAEGWPSYRAGNIDARGYSHGRPGIPLAPSDVAMFDEHLVVEPLTKINPYHPFRSDENFWSPKPSEYKGDWTTMSIIQLPWYEVYIFQTYDVPSDLKG